MPLKISDISNFEPVSNIITAKAIITQRYQKIDLYIQWSKPLTTKVLSSIVLRALFFKNILRIQTCQMKLTEEAPPRTYPKWRESLALRFKFTFVFSISILDLSAAAFETKLPLASWKLSST